MKYILSILASGKFPEVELGKNKYEAIKKASKMIFHGLAMEEKYQIFISNYLEFEKEILDYTVQRMIREPVPYDDYFHVKMGFNRRLINLLTAARLYVDQLHHHLRKCMPDNQNTKEEVTSLFSEEYDNSLEYRFMEALRNYVQHRGLPVHWVQFKGHANGSGKDRMLIFSFQLASQKESLKKDIFKKKVLEEIPEKIDLKMATRVYVEGISRIHCAARRLVEQHLTEARSLFEDVIASYRQVFSEKFVGLFAICLKENKIIERVPLLLEWDDIRIKLSRRNQELINLRNSYVSGQG